MSAGNELAFPMKLESHDPSPGLTKRELFAAMAMQGSAASGVDQTPEQRAMWAVRDADALLRELAKDAP